MRFEVFRAVKILILVFWDVMPCSRIGYNILEEPIAAIFRVEVNLVEMWIGERGGWLTGSWENRRCLKINIHFYV
jgi:hypothetical protein